MTGPALDADHIRAALKSLPHWAFTDDALHRIFKFPDFRTALEFMHACTDEIERCDHHPEWTNVYDQVTVRLTTHDAAGRVTAKDLELAKIIEWQANVWGAT